ncbi:MAG: 4-alpha-glucanotransferase [Bacteroidales bacterium]|nr:4-alpha-glucanotransferase [Bacteroidales bacterium]
MNYQSFSNTKVFKVLNEKENTGSNPKLTGVAVPVFSLNTQNNFGIGEFLDLKQLANWCNKVGMKMIQILPINDTRTDDSWDNSYPYKAISTKALHPIYLNLETLGTLQDENDRTYFEKQKAILKAKDYVDYPEVMKVKDAYFKKIFAQDWDSTKNTEEFQTFFKDNKDWLVPYAVFCSQQPKANSQQPTANSQQPEFYYFLQYHLDKQLRDAVDYLHENGIALKGDIPIGIGRHSVEAYSNPELFNLDCQAGAPPDAFATEGQNWEFPTYNWDAMANDNYQWWRDRLTQMSRYFDAYRIDHILGFFRIWEIPYEYTQGIMGHFSPALSYQQSAISSQLSANYERLTKPYIRGHFLHEYFGEYTNEVREKYLNETSFSYFELKEEFNTQRKITISFDNRQQTTDNRYKDEKIKNGLIALCAEVLFVEDKNKGLHPRIALQFTHSYNELEDYQKNEINKLYDDYFYHRNEELWKEEALKKLPKIIEASDMLVCGEDLGMVPACVKDVMQQLNILSLEVQRMPKNPCETFVNPANNPYLSVDTTSTHDMSTIRGWWEENGEMTNRFYREMLGHQEGAPYFAEPWVCKEIIEQHLKSSSMWVIIPIQDYIAMDGEFRWDQTQREQINVPANSHHHWCYKMHQSLEELNERQSLNETLLSMIKDSGRN